MVTFMCDACGMSVRKNQVEKHYMNQCRSCSVLSCIDCGKDFPGDMYKQHTSCISEAEKYQGHLYQEKENKGEAKQKAWMNKLQERTGNVKDPKIAGLLEKIADYSNVPRKKKKFENFCKNSVRVYDQATLDKLWTAFMGDDDKPAKSEHTNGQVNGHSNGTSEKESTAKPEDSEEEKENSTSTKTTSEESTVTTKEKKKRKNKDEGKTKSKKKRKLEESQEAAEKQTEEAEEPKKKKKKKKKDNSDEENQQPATVEEAADSKQDDTNTAVVETSIIATPGGKFHWHKAIKTALKASDDHELPMKKLRKKVLSAYSAHGMDHRAQSKEESLNMFDKKLKSYPKVKIAKDVVKLVTT